MRATHGITVAELLVALAVVGVLSGFALPAFQGFVARNRSAVELNALLGTLQSARHASITQRAVMTVCPRASPTACGARDTWHLGTLMFTDRNGDGGFDPGDALLRAGPGIESGARIYWRSFRSKSYLQFNPTGLTNWQNGTLLYCPPDGDPRFARAVIINPAGRARKAPDANRDGIPEDSNGTPLRCP
jgi:type IV fimbrial biogenesis protein FimT